MRRGRGAQLESLLDILTALQTSRAGVTLAELAERTGLHVRSVRRYVQDIASRYFPIEDIEGGDGQRRWRFVDGAAGKSVVLGIDESLALGRLRPLALAAAAGLPWRPVLERLFGRIEAAVPSTLRDDIERLAASIGDAAGQARAQIGGDVYAAFENAARARHAVAVRYRSLSGHPRARRFDPYVVYAAEGATYAYGLDHHHGEPRVLALDRVEAVLPMSASFERPVGFSPGQYVEALYRGFRPARPVEVVLRLSGHAARLWSERPEVPAQRTEPLPGGAVRVRFSASDTPALRARLLSFGSELEVEGPEKLRGEIISELERSAAHYRRARARPATLLSEGGQRLGGRKQLRSSAASKRRRSPRE
jgi:predicted DNA-binding transcriptional regulator YafY